MYERTDIEELYDRLEMREMNENILFGQGRNLLNKHNSSTYNYICKEILKGLFTNKLHVRITALLMMLQISAFINIAKDDVRYLLIKINNIKDDNASYRYN